MRASLLRYVEDISDIVEVVREQCMYGVRYNRRVLEFLSQQIERAAGAVCDTVDTPPEDEVVDHWKALEVAVERGKTLIEEHSQPFEFDKFYRVGEAVDLVESICKEIEASLAGLGMARRGMCVKVDSDRIARDKLYMEWYLTCMFDVEDGSLPICEAARDELEVLHSENSARGERMHVIGESAFMWGRSIGHGHGSEVFQARWGAGFHVAVKKFNLSADGKSVEELADFLTEAEISAKWLQHPRIVDCLAASRTGCLVMELARKNLQQLVLEVREISWYVKVQLLTDAAQGLKHLHAQGIVHQAVKSPNFLVFGKTLDSSIVKVADFGFASSRRWSMCSSGSRGVGASDPWVAPEDIDGREATFASDVFSFGIVMYEVASQSLPYGKFTSDQMPQRKEKWGEPCFGLLKCPEELRELMKQCINPDAKARPSMSTVCSTLENLLPKVSPRSNGALGSQKVGFQKSGEFETIDEASTPSSSSSRYDIPRGMDPEKLAAELETLEVDLALEKTVRGVPSYVPGSKTIPPRQEWRQMSTMVPSSASRHSVGASTASVTITLTGTSLVNSHEQPPATQLFEVSSFTENWVKSSRQREHRHSHEERRLSSSTFKSSHGSEALDRARHHRGSSVSEDDTKHLMLGTAYEVPIEEAAVASQRGGPEKHSSSAVGSGLHHGPTRHNDSSNSSAEGKRILHNTAFNSVYCTPSSGASALHMQDDGPTGSYETANTEDNCTAFDELDEAMGPSPTAEELSSASTIFGVRVPAEISPEQQVSTKYTMQWILNKEVQLRRKSNDRTLLHAAAQGGNLDLVAVLAQQYVDIDQIDKYGRTALHDAARWGNADVAQLLLDNGANPSFQDIGGETPLHVAACYNHVSVVQLLLPEVAEKKDMQNNFGNTPLHVAAMSGHLEVLKVLLDEDLDLTIKNKNRKRPQELGDSSVKELIRACQSDRPTLKKRGSQKGLKLFGKS